MARTVIPFGPQHPVLPEPVHLQLTIEDEVIIEAVPAFGYVHRGLEKLAEVRDIHQTVYVVERICGICSTMHALCYCQGMEELMGVEAPRRARYLRVVWSELHRIQSHLLWLGLFADGLGFESLFMEFWKIREKILDIQEATTGNRIIVSVNVIGGVRKDLGPSQKLAVLSTLGDVEAAVDRLGNTLLRDPTLLRRTVGKGVVSAPQARELGLVGPVLRASGVAEDLRLLGYAAFDELEFEPVMERDGDCHARCRVRFREIFQSIDLIRRAMDRMPEGDINIKVRGKPEGEVISRVEQPRGEVFYYIKANGTQRLERLRVRTPTFANIPALVALLPGMGLSDVPVVMLSIDPCISCTER